MFTFETLFSSSGSLRVPYVVSRAFLALVLITAASLHVLAQIDTATLTGRVTDPSDAVVQGARVVVTSVSSGTNREAQANADGFFSIPLLRPGVYDISVSKAGFATARQSGIELSVGQTASVNFKLRVGATTETVEVTTAGPVLETNSAGLGTVVAPKEIVDLPLNGRQFTQLLQLSAGTVPVDVTQNSYTRPGLGSGAVTPSINGQTNRSNLFYIDGIYATDPFFSGFSMSPSIDAIQEFKEQTHTDEAEIGGSTGGTINVATKSGSNQFHGSAYEFFRNDILDAQNYFAVKKGAYKQNQFGATFGGPIVPKKLFFFGFYEGYRSILAANNFTIVPTTAELGGDFSALTTPIYDPTTYNSTTGTIQQFSYNGVPNVIPPGDLNQGILSVLKAYVPAPNYSAPGSPFNYLNTESEMVSQDQWGVRGDYTIGQNDSLFGRVTMSNANHVEPQQLPLNPFSVGFNGRNVGVNWIHTFTPNLIAQFTLGYNYINIPQQEGEPGAAGVFQTGGFDQGFTEYPGAVKVPLTPGLVPAGYFSFPSGWGPIGPQSLGQYSGSISKHSGKHDLKFGASAYQTWMYTNWAGDTLQFNQQATWDPTTRTGGDSVASMLLGLPNSASRQLGNSGVSLRGKVFDIFAQDSWKLNPKLTVNYGLRWDYASPVTDTHNRLAGFDFRSGDWLIPKGDTDLPSGSLPAGVAVSSRDTITAPNYHNFSPRLGLAYQLAKRTVVRAGVGIFYDDWSGDLQAAQSARGSWPSGASQDPSNLNIAGVTPGATAQNPFGASAPVLPTTPFPSGGGFLDTDWKDAYSLQWNLEVQEQLSNSASLSLGYVGSSTIRNPIEVPFNLAQPGPGPLTGRVPYADMYTFAVLESVGRIHYDALQAKFDKRYSGGLSFLTSFTWSRDFGLGCADYWEGCNIQNPYNLNGERGPSPLDVPLVFTFGSVYELPFGKGKTYLDSGGPASVLFGNWQVNGLVSARSGTPYSVTLNFDNANVGGGTQRPNLVGDPHLSNPSPSEWFNTAAFVLPAPYTYGNVGFDSLHGPRYSDVDLSVFRNFHLFERGNLQFRAEFFNALNHPNFANPNSTLGNAGFGSIASITGSPRNIQFALKLTF